jgi:drug/metabolite transporter (DMT)-like permease
MGTLYQKRFCAHVDLRASGTIQFAATGLAMALLSALTETGTVRWTPTFIGALLWLSIALSLGAISLLYLMIRNNQTARVASLFFLTPSFTALMAWLLFGQALPAMALAGFALSGAGVYLVMRAPAGVRAPAVGAVGAVGAVEKHVHEPHEVKHTTN